jgi:hypothetical protein
LDTSRQYDLPLIDPTEPRILPHDGDAYFAVCRWDGTEERMRQRCVRLRLIEPTLRALRNAIDTYLSQGTFAQPTRRTVHLAWLTHAYLDLDGYDLQGGARLRCDPAARPLRCGGRVHGAAASSRRTRCARRASTASPPR